MCTDPREHTRRYEYVCTDPRVQIHRYRFVHTDSLVQTHRYSFDADSFELGLVTWTCELRLVSWAFEVAPGHAGWGGLGEGQGTVGQELGASWPAENQAKAGKG